MKMNKIAIVVHGGAGEGTSTKFKRVIKETIRMSIKQLI